eukprot:sb/3474518/
MLVRQIYAIHRSEDSLVFVEVFEEDHQTPEQHYLQQQSRGQSSGVLNILANHHMFITKALETAKEMRRLQDENLRLRGALGERHGRTRILEGEIRTLRSLLITEIERDRERKIEKEGRGERERKRLCVPIAAVDSY